MKVFANREIRNLFQAVLAVWAVALALTQGVAWHTTHAFSFGSLFVFLLLGGCLWGILFCYFQRQSALLEQAVQQIQSCLDGNPDARLDCDREGELYRLFHSVNALAAVLSAHADNEQREKHFLKNIDFADFEAKVKECSIFLLCNPHNPLGIVWDPADLRRMAEICIANNTLLVSDEIHSDLIFHGKHHTPTATLSPEIAAHIITCVSATKTFNLAGLQASTTIFPNAEMKAVFDKFWGGMDIHRNNAFSSVAMEAAYREGEEWLEQLLPYISANFDYVCDYCAKNIPQIKPNCPDATYLMWLDCRALGMSNEELRDFFIHKAKLGLNEGYTFGRSLSGYMRLNAACPRATLEKAMAQLKVAVDSL